MTKYELASRIAAHFPALTVSDADAAVNLILQVMASRLTRGDRIEIRGFGSFSLNYRRPRDGRNPKTGETVKVPGKYVPHFTMGKALQSRLAAAFMTKINRPHYTLSELIKQMPDGAPIDRAWENMAPVGKEIL